MYNLLETGNNISKKVIRQKGTKLFRQYYLHI